MTKKTEFQNWWADHGGEYNTLRRERYAANAATREKAKKQARTYRKTHPPAKAPLSATGLISARDAAKEIGREPPVFGTWEAAKVIPVQKINGQRWYTPHQVYLLGEVAKAMDLFHVSRDQFDAAIKAMKHKVASEWGLKPTKGWK